MFPQLYRDEKVGLLLILQTPTKQTIYESPGRSPCLISCLGTRRRARTQGGKNTESAVDRESLGTYGRAWVRFAVELQTR